MWNGFFQEKSFFSYARCDECGLLYAPDYFCIEQLEKLYRQMPANMDVVDTEALKRTQKGYFERLRRHSLLEKSYVEVGPDIGLFTEYCAKEGSFDKYWLIEPNKAVKDRLCQSVGNNACEVIHDMLDFSIIPDGTISVLVMIHVLDHLLDPVATLRELKRTLLPDATVLIVTHDESSLLSKMLSARWPAYCLQHPQLFNRSSMRNLLDVAGYDVIDQTATVNHFPLKFLIDHFLWVFGLKTKMVPSFWDISVGLKLGNMITVARPKA